MCFFLSTHKVHISCLPLCTVFVFTAVKKHRTATVFFEVIFCSPYLPVYALRRSPFGLFSALSDEGETFLRYTPGFSPSVFAYSESTSLVRGRLILRTQFAIHNVHRSKTMNISQFRSTKIYRFWLPLTRVSEAKSR